MKNRPYKFWPNAIPAIPCIIVIPIYLFDIKVRISRSAEPGQYHMFTAMLAVVFGLFVLWLLGWLAFRVRKLYLRIGVALIVLWALFATEVTLNIVKYIWV